MSKAVLRLGDVRKIAIVWSRRAYVYHQLGMWHDETTTYLVVPCDRVAYVTVQDFSKPIWLLYPIAAWRVYRPAALEIAIPQEVSVRIFQRDMAELLDYVKTFNAHWECIRP